VEEHRGTKSGGAQRNTEWRSTEEHRVEESGGTQSGGGKEEKTYTEGRRVKEHRVEEGRRRVKEHRVEEGRRRAGTQGNTEWRNTEVHLIAWRPM